MATICSACRTAEAIKHLQEARRLVEMEYIADSDHGARQRTIAALKTINTTISQLRGLA